MFRSFRGKTSEGREKESEREGGRKREEWERKREGGGTKRIENNCSTSDSIVPSYAFRARARAFVRFCSFFILSFVPVPVMKPFNSLISRIPRDSIRESVESLNRGGKGF